MDFKTYFQESAEEINQELKIFLEKWVEEIASINPKFKPLAQLLADASEGGKRIRGTLIKLGYELAQLSLHSTSEESSVRKLTLPPSEVIRVAVAYELFQTAILAHDDVIDESLLRRGKATIFKSLGADHYAISQVIGLGDLGLFTAVKLIADTKFPAEIKNEAIGFFAEVMTKTALGEILDVELPHLEEDWLEDDVIMIHKLKTAYYTISGPLILGATLAGADEDFKQNLSKFSEGLGIAFQIQDDILGVFGEEEEIGKSVTSDVEEGKNTLLITEGLKHANEEQKKILTRNYGNGKLNDEQFNEIKEIFVSTGALDYSKKMAEKYVEKAKKVIPEITKDEVFGKILEQMADYLVKRIK